MAISDSFNVDNALNSQSYAYKCWYNYNYESNTMGISSADMGKITKEWKGEVSNWKATASDDENAYEIEDDDYSGSKTAGANQAKEKTGYEGGGKTGMWTRAVGDSVSGLAGTAATTVASGVANNLAEGVASKLMLGSETVNKLGEGGAVKASKSASWLIAAPLALTTGTVYQAKKPNKEQKEACDELQNEMVNADSSLAEAQGVMEEADAEIIELSDEAQAQNEDANEDIEDKKTEFDMYKASYDALKAKAESGETLSEDEKALMKELAPKMQELGEGINETSEDTTESVGELYDEMGSYQANYDDAASTVAEVEGLTDYAESFDGATRATCYVEGAAQTLNAASGTQAAVKAGKFAASGGWVTAWAWGFAAMGAAGAAMSGVGAAEQFKWAGEVGTEIGMRESTQELNNTTSELYDERIADYEGYMENTEELELEIPEDLEVPEEGTASTASANTTGETDAAASTGFGLASASEDDKSGDKKAKEEKF